MNINDVPRNTDVPENSIFGNVGASAKWIADQQDAEIAESLRSGMVGASVGMDVVRSGFNQVVEPAADWTYDPARAVAERINQGTLRYLISQCEQMPIHGRTPQTRGIHRTAKLKRGIGAPSSSSKKAAPADPHKLAMRRQRDLGISPRQQKKAFKAARREALAIENELRTQA